MIFMYNSPKPMSSSDSSSGSSFFFSSFAGAASVLTGAATAGALKEQNENSFHKIIKTIKKIVYQDE